MFHAYALVFLRRGARRSAAPGRRAVPWRPWAPRWIQACLTLALLGPPAAQANPDGTREPREAREGGPVPAAVAQALLRAAVPLDAVSLVVQEVGALQPRLRVNEWQPRNPASLMKLPTTLAALERLGPAYAWTTPVWFTGPVQGGVLEGSLVIKGSGDPQLVLERLWLLLRRVQQAGVREIRGDIVLDASAFAVPEVDAGDFDGEPLRPYNVRPSALLLNYRSVVYGFVPDEAAGLARIVAEPPLAGLQLDRSVPLVGGPCGDWRGQLKAGFEPGRTRFAGSYPSACGELSWPVADPQPATYDARLIGALWAEMGGRLLGSVREGLAPVGAKPALEWRSPSLAEVVRDINKYSNNVMAQQLFLTLALQDKAGREPATPEAARQLLARWLAERTGEATGGDLVVDNGSGLSRANRLSAARLARLLQLAWDGPHLSELMSSLPIGGVDGTLRRSRATPGRAHLKTGSLRDVAGVAGYVLSHSGRRYIVVALVNHPAAGAARPAFDALVQWVQRDAPAR